MAHIWTERTIDIAAEHGIAITEKFADELLDDHDLAFEAEMPPDRKLHRFFALVAAVLPREPAA